MDGVTITYYAMPTHLVLHIEEYDIQPGHSSKDYELVMHIAHDSPESDVVRQVAIEIRTLVGLRNTEGCTVRPFLSNTAGWVYEERRCAT